MNWLDGFRKRNRLTADDNQMDKLTLDSAREQIAAQATEIQGLQARITEFEGTTQTKDLELATLRTDLSAIQAEKVAWEAEKEKMVFAAAQVATDLTVAQAQVADLQKKDMNADIRAAERLAGLHGKPLSLSSQGGIELTAEDLRKQLNSEKDSAIRFVLYKKLKAIEAK